MPLSSLLQTLASDDATFDERERAASALDRELRRWAGGVIRRRFPRVPDTLVDEARQKVLLKASLGNSRFRGEDDRAARAWCNRILQRHVVDWLRRSGRQVDLDAAPEPGTSHEADPVLAQDLDRLLERLDAALVRLTRERDVANVRTNLRCHLEARLGATIEEQMARWASLEDGAGSTEARRARDRVYQYRRRGKVAGWEAVQALAAAGEATPEEIDLLIKLVGAPGEEEP